MTLNDVITEVVQGVRDHTIPVGVLQERIMGHMGGWDPVTHAAVGKPGDPLRVVWTAMVPIMKAYGWTTFAALAGHSLDEESSDVSRYEELKAGVLKRIRDYWEGFMRGEVTGV